MVTGALLISLLLGSVAAQSLRDFVPVGVQYQEAEDARIRQRDLEEMRRLRFNVVSVIKTDQPATLSFIDRVLAGAPYPEVLMEAGDTTAIIPTAGTRDEVRLEAWSALSRGARAFLFGSWADLQRNLEGLAGAAEFAEAVTRNAALYAALRPRSPDGLRIDVRESGVEARLLESSEALLLVVLNRASQRRAALITFAPSIPEAIWRNMFTGGSVSFVTGPDGPTYSRTFEPKEVLVLMISRRRA
jgi:hypothetical protein